LYFFAFTSNALKKSKNKEKAMTALSTFRLKTTPCYDHKKEYVQSKKKEYFVRVHVVQLFMAYT
jgi:hypothetical protein